MNAEPIFIVGAPRSGTTLLAALLAAHSRMSCGPETHFFRWLSKTDPKELCDRKRWPDAAVDFLNTITFPTFSDGNRINLLEKYQIDRTQIEAYLNGKEPSIVNILSSITEQYMIRMGKNRWVEKSPDHISQVYAIREHFPHSPIVRILRDPRDVAISLNKMSWGVETFLEGLLYWRHLDEASEKFFAADICCITLRYEDLLSYPREELQKLCRFIGEDFEEGMLDTSSTGKQLNSQNVPWKAKASQPIDTSKIATWRNTLTRGENQLAEAVLGDLLEVYGYPRESEFVRFGEIYPSSLLATKYAEGLQILTSRGIRFWKIYDGEKPTLKVFLGDPGDDHWLGDKKFKRVISMSSIAAKVIKSRIANYMVCWVPEGSDEKWSGYLDYMVRRLLVPYRVLDIPENQTSGDSE
jgi:hypothetical protein